MKVHIEGRQDLVRDISSRAVLNTDKVEYENHLARRQLLLKQRGTVESQQEEINNLKTELSDIKQMIQTLLKDRNG